MGEYLLYFSYFLSLKLIIDIEFFEKDNSYFFHSVNFHRIIVVIMKFQFEMYFQMIFY